MPASEAAQMLDILYKHAVDLEAGLNHLRARLEPVLDPCTDQDPSPAAPPEPSRKAPLLMQMEAIDTQLRSSGELLRWIVDRLVI
jgi:hypothetical protein